jgi:hypothetical protein
MRHPIFQALEGCERKEFVQLQTGEEKVPDGTVFLLKQTQNNLAFVALLFSG